MGPRTYGLNPAVLRILLKYKATINNKLYSRKLPPANLQMLVGAILSQFLLQNKERIFDEFNFLVAKTARRSLSKIFTTEELEAFGLSNVPDDGGIDRRTTKAVLGFRTKPKKLVRSTRRKSGSSVPGKPGRPRKVRPADTSTAGTNDEGKALH